MGDKVSEAQSQGYRYVTIPDPKNVVCCCWCCGMVLKDCGPRCTNPNRDVLGPFFTDVDVDQDRVPALHVLGEPGSTGYNVGMNQFGQAAACCTCAKHVVCSSSDGDSSAAAANKEKWIRQCEAWLKSSDAANGFPDLNWVEHRLISQIELDQTPDLSNGPASTAGFFRKEGSGKKKVYVPFSYNKLEELAFPGLLLSASGYDGHDNLTDLIHYTFMRLYSVDRRWREHPDYVVFSIHRLAAYGSDVAKEALPKFPRPVPAEDMSTQQQIGLIGDFL